MPVKVGPRVASCCAPRLYELYSGGINRYLRKQEEDEEAEEEEGRSETSVTRSEVVGERADHEVKRRT